MKERQKEPILKDPANAWRQHVGASFLSREQTYQKKCQNNERNEEKYAGMHEYAQS
jgi:hypothetical protein